MSCHLFWWSVQFRTAEDFIATPKYYYSERKQKQGPWSKYRWLLHFYFGEVYGFFITVMIPGLIQLWKAYLQESFPCDIYAHLCILHHFAVSCLSSFGFSIGFCVHTRKFRSKGHNTNLSRHKPLKELRLRRRCLHPAHDQACVVAVLREMLSPRNLNSLEKVGILKVCEWAFGCKTQLVTIQFAMPEGLRKRWLASIFMYRGCGIPANGGLFGFPSRNSHGQSVHAICTLPTIKWAFFLGGNWQSAFFERNSALFRMFRSTWGALACSCSDWS